MEKISTLGTPWRSATVSFVVMIIFACIFCFVISVQAQGQGHAKALSEVGLVLQGFQGRSLPLS